MSDFDTQAEEFHKQHQGKLTTKSITKIKNRDDLSIVYTPGVAKISKIIAENKELSFDYTLRGRTVAIVSDGSSVLGLGNIGPEAAMPVMEGKSLLLTEFADIDSFPLCINTQNPEEIIKFVKQIAPSFAGINLEDIAAPNCFIVEDSLQDIGIPVFHDDQHGTAIVVKAALINSAKVADKNYEDLNVVIVGAGAAGLATARMLLGLNCSESSCTRVQGAMSVKDVIVCDSQGAIYKNRDNLNIYKQAIAGMSNVENKTGRLDEVIKNADVVIGVSGPGLITQDMVRSMADKAIVFAMANPIPEIMPELAKEAGAYIVATGRSDYPNQINNALAFPGVFRAVIDGRLTKITHLMKEKIALKLASIVGNPDQNNIIPDIFHPNLAKILAKAALED